MFALAFQLVSINMRATDESHINETRFYVPICQLGIFDKFYRLFILNVEGKTINCNMALFHPFRVAWCYISYCNK